MSISLNTANSYDYSLQQPLGQALNKKAEENEDQVAQTYLSSAVYDAREVSETTQQSREGSDAGGLHIDTYA